jgi:uncharacterized protein (DUF433 family)
MKYDLIEKIPGVCGGAPIINGRRITVENVVSGIYYNDDIYDYLNDFEISIQTAKQATEYCKTLQCQKEAPYGYCSNCILRTLKDGWDFDSSKMSEIIFPDGGKVTIDGNNIFIGGGIEDYADHSFGVMGWHLADLVSKKYESQLGNSFSW